MGGDVLDTSIILLVVLAALLMLLWVAKIIFRFREFKSQLNYINQEIRRGSERSLPYWKKRRRKLWRHYLLHPF